MKEKESIKNGIKSKRILIILGVVIMIVLLCMIPNKKGNIEISVKSSLERLVEKSDLETAKFTYNVIAKQCKDKNNCNKNSNNIDDFEYVVSCQGTLTAGIDFKNIKVDVNEKDKKLQVTMPEASIKNINVVSLKFLNGEDVSASEFPNARKLCEDTSKEKSKKDGDLLPAAKEQAKVVIKAFYEQWLKAIDEDYTVEFK